MIIIMMFLNSDILIEFQEKVNKKKAIEIYRNIIIFIGLKFKKKLQIHKKTTIFLEKK